MGCRVLDVGYSFVFATQGASTVAGVRRLPPGLSSHQLGPSRVDDGEACMWMCTILPSKASLC